MGKWNCCSAKPPSSPKLTQTYFNYPINHSELAKAKPFGVILLLLDILKNKKLALLLDLT